MKSTIWLGVLALFLLVGCAAIKQGIVDYQAGKSTPLATDEKSPKDSAQEIIDLVKNIPVVGNYAGVLFPVLIGFFTWKRGSKLRKGEGSTSTLATGIFGTKIGIGSFNLENSFQIVTDFFRGLYEIGVDGSGFKRSWKILVSIVLAIVSSILVIPQAKEFIFNNGSMISIVSIISALFGGIEKKLQDVKSLEK